MYRLYSKVPKGLEPIGSIFKAVLTTGFWPSYKSSNLNLSDEMVKCVEVFKQFYQTKAKHRKLTWVYSLGSCNISGKFGPKTIELVVGTYQEIVRRKVKKNIMSNGVLILVALLACLLDFFIRYPI